MTFKFPKDSSDIVTKQVTQTVNDLSFYEKLSESEYSTMQSYIDSPSKILELGCGLGRMSVYLNWKLDNDPLFILADSTWKKPIKKVKYGWKPKEKVFYNNLNVTKDFCNLNGLENHQVFDLQKESLIKLSNIDLVISFMSVGFHYPIDNYLDTLLNITTKNCTMIFGIRKDTYTENSFKDKFATVKIMQQKDIDVKEDILILKDKI